MADVTNNWIGTGTAGDLTAVANWSTGATPGANDRAYWLKENTGVSGPQSNMAGLTAIDLDAGIVGEGYTQSIGGSGTEFDISADLWIYRGSAGKLWLKDGAGTTDLIIIDSTSSDPLNHDCFSFTGATATKMLIQRGKGTILTGATVTDLEVSSRTKGAIEAHCVINPGTITITRSLQEAGLVTCSQALADVKIYGGEWNQILGVLGSTMLDVRGGRCNLKVAGTYTNVTVRPGAILDVSQDGSRKIITNFYEHPGSIVIGRELLKVTNNMLNP